MGRLIIRHVDDQPWQEGRAQLHGDQRVCVSNRVLQWAPHLVVLHTRYDPGLVLERHGHGSEQIIYILDGEVMVGDQRCPAGTCIILEVGATFGPLIAGPEGAHLFEVSLGEPLPAGTDPDEFAQVLAERGITRLPNPVFIVPDDVKEMSSSNPPLS